MWIVLFNQSNSCAACVFLTNCEIQQSGQKRILIRGFTEGTAAVRRFTNLPVLRVVAPRFRVGLVIEVPALTRTVGLLQPGRLFAVLHMVVAEDCIETVIVARGR